MNRKQLYANILEKESFLCIGLDTDIDQIPKFLLDYNDPIYEFNKRIIDATHDICVAYKPNIAFYEALGPKGWETLEKTMDYIPDNIFTIADAKRGDIGNTSDRYAKTYFEYFDFDAVTVAPYMGVDSVSPFLAYEDKWVILLALTSNAGSNDFQRIVDKDGKPLYKSVIETSKKWGSPDNIMYVIGATHPSDFTEIRELAEEHFFLVPGIGAQGGDLASVVKYGSNDLCGLLVNSSRGIIYAGDDELFANAARQSALVLKNQMAPSL